MKQFDLIIIGNDLQTAAIAYDATLRGLNVLVLAAAAIGYEDGVAVDSIVRLNQSKLNDDFGFANIASDEWQFLQNSYAEYLNQIPTLFPVMPRDEGRLKNLRFLHPWHWTKAFSEGSAYQQLTREKALKLAPQLNLQMNYAYRLQAWTLPLPILTKMLMQKALAAGCKLVAPANIQSLVSESGDVRGVIAGALRYQADFVVNVLSPNTAHLGEVLGLNPQVQWIKQSYLLLGKNLAEQNGIIFIGMDGQKHFAIPTLNGTLIGPFRQYYFDQLQNVYPDRNTVMALNMALKNVLPDLANAKMLRSYCKLVPYPLDKNEDDGVIIDHELQEGVSAYLSIYTASALNHRSLAKRVVDFVVDKAGRFEPCKTHHQIFSKAAPSVINIDWLQAYGLSEDTVQALLNRHGENINAILELIATNPIFANLLCHHHHVLAAEVIDLIRSSHASGLEEIAGSLGLMQHACEDTCLLAAARVMAAELGLGAEAISSQLQTILLKKAGEYQSIAKHADARKMSFMRYQYEIVGGYAF